MSLCNKCGKLPCPAARSTTLACDSFIPTEDNQPQEEIAKLQAELKELRAQREHDNAIIANWQKSYVSLIDKYHQASDLLHRWRDLLSVDGKAFKLAEETTAHIGLVQRMRDEKRPIAGTQEERTVGQVRRKKVAETLLDAAKAMVGAAIVSAEAIDPDDPETSYRVKFPREYTTKLKELLAAIRAAEEG